MATNFRVVDTSFRIGCGRYIQENGAIVKLPEELARLGTKRVVTVMDSNIEKMLGERVRALLDGAGLPYVSVVYDLPCNRENAKAETERLQNGDTVVGIGGGVICDYAKLIAAWGNCPVVCVPTSSATCAAYTPLSVTYTTEYKAMGTVHHPREVDCVIADMDILCRQPARLLAAGAYDAMAKMIETAQRLGGREENEIEIGVRSAFELSRFTYQRLSDILPKACADVNAGVCSKEVFDAVYLSIAATGVISGMARGSNQTAIAHKVYEGSRTLFPLAVKDALHGELVGMGLITQLYYNGDEDGARAMRQRLLGDHLPVSLTALGVEKEQLMPLHDWMLGTSAMAGTSDAEKARLTDALALIFD